MTEKTVYNGLVMVTLVTIIVVGLLKIFYYEQGGFAFNPYLAWTLIFFIVILNIFAIADRVKNTGFVLLHASFLILLAAGALFYLQEMSLYLTAAEGMPSVVPGENLGVEINEVKPVVMDNRYLTDLEVNATMSRGRHTEQFSIKINQPAVFEDRQFTLLRYGPSLRFALTGQGDFSIFDGFINFDLFQKKKDSYYLAENNVRIDVEPEPETVERFRVSGNFVGEDFGPVVMKAGDRIAFHKFTLYLFEQRRWARLRITSSRPKLFFHISFYIFLAGSILFIRKAFHASR